MTITDPAVGAAVVTAAVDNFSGVTYGQSGRNDSGPKTQWIEDCASIIRDAYASIGIGGLDSSTYGQVTQGADVGTDLANAQPGDVIFYDVPGEKNPGHEALYAGNDQVFQATTYGQLSGLAPVGSASEYPIADIRDFTGGVAGGTDTTAPIATSTAPSSSTSSSSGGITGDILNGGAYVALLGGGLALVVLGVFRTANPGGRSGGVGA